MLIDTHAHLQDESLYPEVKEVLERAATAGVETIICPGYDLESSRAAVKLAQLYPQVYAAVGIHPHDADSLNDNTMAELYSLAREARVVAVGEIGLDYYRDLSPRDVQKKAFRAQINLAREVNKPIIIHDRDAHQEVLDIVTQEKAGRNQGIMHCYSGSLPLAISFLKLGFYISFAGPLTYKNNRKTLEVAATIPMDRILVETDCPYLTPEPYRGKRNEPAYVVQTATCLAQVRKKSLEETAYLTSRNARVVYRIKS
jgi:TatD DNase family protein